MIQYKIKCNLNVLLGDMPKNEITTCKFFRNIYTCWYVYSIKQIKAQFSNTNMDLHGRDTLQRQSYMYVNLKDIVSILNILKFLINAIFLS